MKLIPRDRLSSHATGAMATLEQLLPRIPYAPDVITVDNLRKAARIGKAKVQEAVAAGLGKSIGRIGGKKGGIYRLKNDGLKNDGPVLDSPSQFATSRPADSDPCRESAIRPPFRGLVRDAPHGLNRGLSSLGALETLSDARLAAALEEELASLRPKPRVFALALGSGQPATEAARTAKLSVQPVALMRQKRRTADALRLLREQARRASMLTLEVAVEKFRKLSEEARAAEDYSAAARALREACLLLDLYPSARIDLTHRVNLGEVTEQEWLALARLRHEVRQALPAAAMVTDAVVVPTPVEALPTPSGFAREGGTP